MKWDVGPIFHMRRRHIGASRGLPLSFDGQFRSGKLDVGATTKFLALIAEAHRREDWLAVAEPKPGRAVPVPPSIGRGWRHIAMGFSIAGSAILNRTRR